MCVFSNVQLFLIPWTRAHQALLSMRLPQQEYWSGCHFLFQSFFLTQGLNPSLLHFLHWKVDSLPLHPLEAPVFKCRGF